MKQSGFDTQQQQHADYHHDQHCLAIINDNNTKLQNNTNEKEKQMARPNPKMTPNARNTNNSNNINNNNIANMRNFGDVQNMGSMANMGMMIHMGNGGENRNFLQQQQQRVHSSQANPQSDKFLPSPCASIISKFTRNVNNNDNNNRNSNSNHVLNLQVVMPDLMDTMSDNDNNDNVNYNNASSL